MTVLRPAGSKSGAPRAGQYARRSGWRGPVLPGSASGAPRRPPSRGCPLPCSGAVGTAARIRSVASASLSRRTTVSRSARYPSVTAPGSMCARARRRISLISLRNDWLGALVAQLMPMKHFPPHCHPLRGARTGSRSDIVSLTRQRGVRQVGARPTPCQDDAPVPATVDPILPHLLHWLATAVPGRRRRVLALGALVLIGHCTSPPLVSLLNPPSMTEQLPYPRDVERGAETSRKRGFGVNATICTLSKRPASRLRRKSPSIPLARSAGTVQRARPGCHSPLRASLWARRAPHRQPG
jgi:hypothetical protein